MTFQKGVSGNPRGRPKKGMTMSDRLHKAVNRKYGGLTTADLIVNAAVRLAAKGDMKAIAFVFERIDGKVTQHVDLTSVVRRIAEAEGLDPQSILAEAARIAAEAEYFQ